MGAPPGRPLGTAFFVFAARVGKHERRVPQVSILKPGIAQSSTHEIARSETYSIFGIGVDRKHALKWLFPQGKATFHCCKEVYVYSENALELVASTMLSKATASARAPSFRLSSGERVGNFKSKRDEFTRAET